jgi:hypothetical protein
MGSYFENFTDDQLLKYARYTKKVLGNKWNIPFIDFYNGIFEGERLYTLLHNPISWKLSRFDIEYLYYILNNNNLEEGITDKPDLEMVYPSFIVKERVYVTTTYTGEVETYIPNDIDSGYMYALQDSDDIEPWDWEENEREETDRDSYDTEFELY